MLTVVGPDIGMQKKKKKISENHFQAYLANMFALKLPTLQSNGIQCIGERQGPARISGSAETVADDDEDAVMMTILVMMVVTMMMVMLMLLLLILSSLPDNRLSTSSFLKKKRIF